jgi:hypothetical protein
MDYKARFYSQSLGRFLQPDSIIPSLFNPQSWNRYSYVTNRPINFNDPTGHWGDSNSACGVRGDQCSDSHVSSVSSPSYPGPGNDDDIVHRGNHGNREDELASYESNNSETEDVFTIILTQLGELYIQIEEQGGCEDFWNDPLCLDYVSIMSQDISTLASITGALSTSISIAFGCAAGSEAGVLPGCVGGYVAGVGFHVAVTNRLETMASFASLVTTIRSDFVTQDSNLSTWEFGEDTKTSILTFTFGTLITDPFVDSAIDIYASGYNHGFFCGASTILDCLQ